jgi:hypothetical protein
MFVRCRSEVGLLFRQAGSTRVRKAGKNAFDRAAIKTPQGAREQV